jgi:hypothetical protein
VTEAARGKWGRVAKLAALAGVAVLTFPPTFVAYGPGVDPAWMYAVNRAAADGLRFGREFAFPYGPLGFVACPMDVGANLALATLFRVALHAVWLGAVAALAWPHPAGRAVPFLAGAALAVAPVHPDAYNLDRVGALVTAVPYLLVVAAATGGRWPAVLAGVVAGAAVLVKTNVGVACLGAVAGFGAAEILRSGRPGLWRAAVPFGVAGLTALALGLPNFGGLGAVADHVRAALLIADGYSSHMTSYDEPGEWGSPPRLVAAAAAVALVGAGWTAYAQRDLRADVLILGFPLFTLYKSAVVRCDPGHWRPALFHALALLAVFAVRGRTRPARAVGLTAAAVAAGVWADAFATQRLADRLGWGVRAVRQLAEWPTARADLAAAERNPTAEALAGFPYPPPGGYGPEFRPPVPVRPWLPSLDRTARTDVYPFDLLVARDAGLNWRPRYVPQSYAAYHPALDAAAAETYRRPDAPAFVVFQLSALDRYLPSAVDPETFAELIRWYESDRRLDPDTLLLRRRAAPALGDPRPVGRGVARPGEVLPVPPAGPGEVVFLKLGYRLTAVGRALSAGYRVEPPRVGLVFPGGAATAPKVGWRNAASGFLVSPLPFGLDGMEALFRGADLPGTAAVVPQPNPAFAEDVPYEWRKAGRP